MTPLLPMTKIEPRAIRFRKRPLSHSQLSSWEYSKEQWYDNYILRKPRGTSTAMQAGSIIGDSIGTPQSLVPSLAPPGVKEYPLTCQLGDIYLIGYADHWCPDTLELNENKTTTNAKKWTQGTADRHPQLTMYALMLFLRHNIRPEDVTMYLNSIRVIEGPDLRYYLPNPPEVKRIATKRTAEQVADYVNYIHQTVADMEAYVEARTNADLSPEEALPTTEEVVI